MKLIICHDGTVLPWHAAVRFYKWGCSVFASTVDGAEHKICDGDDVMDAIRLHTVDL